MTPKIRMPALLSRFLLVQAESRARGLAGRQRETLRDDVLRLEQKIESAKILWASEQHAEALLSGRDAATQARVLWEAFGSVGDLSPTERTSLNDGWAIAHAVHIPSLNREVGPAHERTLEKLLQAAEAVRNQLAPSVLTPGRILFLRWRRLVSVFVLLIGSTTLAVVWNNKLPDVRASAFYGNDARFAPKKARDGNPTTEWLLPNRTMGWVEVPTGGRKVNTIKILNALNPPYKDRATRDFRLELFRGMTMVYSAKHSFSAFSATPMWLSIPVNAPEVDRILIHVDTFHGSGGGLAEVAWE